MEVMKEMFAGAGFIVSWFLLVYLTVYYGTRAWCKARAKTQFINNTYNLYARSVEEAQELAQRFNGAQATTKPGKNATTDTIIGSSGE